MADQMAHMHCEELATFSMCECQLSGTTNANSCRQPLAAKCEMQRVGLCCAVRLLHGAIGRICKCKLSLLIAQIGTAKHHENPARSRKRNQKGTTSALEGLNPLVAQGCHHSCADSLYWGSPQEGPKEPFSCGLDCRRELFTCALWIAVGMPKQEVRTRECIPRRPSW